MGVPDIVVPVREGAVNEQLRYALRSWAAHLPHGRVWLVGHRPQWAAGVGHIPTRQAGTKYQNTTVAVRAACEHPDVSERFLLCNDDFFAMHPVEEMPVFHRGPVRRVEAYYAARASGKYLRGMRETRELLESLGHPEPLSYELHVPLPVDRAGMLNVLELGIKPSVIVRGSSRSLTWGSAGHGDDLRFTLCDVESHNGPGGRRCRVSLQEPLIGRLLPNCRPFGWSCMRQCLGVPMRCSS
ncbi:hypothetical protein [Streptomyces sp. NBC_01589]|uniref:hypothetical protein n=1 Tax=unclassified Streptomyces TaxID=2593676 RepID=UPI003863C91F